MSKNIEHTGIVIGDNLTVDSSDNISTASVDTPIEFTKNEEPNGKDFTWKGVKFPGWAQGPHFIVLNGSFVLAIDPNCVTMEMKTNWVQKYVPILVQKGKEVLEKLLKEEIRTI